jgi:hypothetical protein
MDAGVPGFVYVNNSRELLYAPLIHVGREPFEKSACQLSVVCNLVPEVTGIKCKMEGVL